MSLLPTYTTWPIRIARGDGAYVWDAEGRRYLDLYGGHCVTLLGHCPPRVVEAVQAQAGALMFYSNVVGSDLRDRAAAKLAALAPGGVGHVFFCNSGTEANETALKMARTATGRRRVVAMHGGFHGRTLGSLAATGMPAYRDPHADVLPPAHFVPFGDAGAVERVLAADADVAAVIVEPIQSMAGVVTAPPAYFAALRRACDAHGALLIFDEVQTGVGRTGTFSIADALGVTPDLITMAKSLGSGVPVGATLASDALAAGVRPGQHGSTFGGGMLAMAAVEATLAALEADGLMQQAPVLFAHLEASLSGLDVEVRGRGALMGVRLPVPAAPVAAALREAEILVGTSSDPHVLRLMPALVTPLDAIDAFAAALSDILHAVPASAHA